MRRCDDRPGEKQNTKINCSDQKLLLERAPRSGRVAEISQVPWFPGNPAVELCLGVKHPATRVNHKPVRRADSVEWSFGWLRALHPVIQQAEPRDETIMHGFLPVEEGQQSA